MLTVLTNIRSTKVLHLASSIMHHESCIMHRASFILHHALCIMHNASCIMLHASCIAGRRLRFGMLTALTNIRSTKGLWQVEDDLWWKTTYGGRQPLVEDNFWWKTILACCLVCFAAFFMNCLCLAQHLFTLLSQLVYDLFMPCT